MLISSTEVQNNFGKYLELSATHKIVITRNGLPIARLVGMEKSISFLADQLVGLLPADTDEKSEREARLARQ